jgi:hypothetical protein
MKIPKQQYGLSSRIGGHAVRDGQSAGAVAKELGLMIAATLVERRRR